MTLEKYFYFCTFSSQAGMVLMMAAVLAYLVVAKDEMRMMPWFIFCLCTLILGSILPMGFLYVGTAVYAFIDEWKARKADK